MRWPGRPIILPLTEGQMRDHNGAAIIFPVLPQADTLIGDKGYDSDAFRDALIERQITPCIPPRAKQPAPATYCKDLYKQRHKIANMFANRKTGTVFQPDTTDAPTHNFNAICISATVIFWLYQ